jgi:hypothetical protein
MDWWQELARDEKQYDTRGKIMLADAVRELEVLIEHGPQR